ncbi:MAG: phage tail assembly chaperone [Pseudomonadota bacterium]
MSRLILEPAPTFAATVKIPQPGGGVLEVPWTFAHMGEAALKEFSTGEDSKSRSDIDTILEMSKGGGWTGDTDREFNAENVAWFLDLHRAAVAAIISAYYAEIGRQRLGN